jgi:urease accessory protein
MIVIEQLADPPAPAALAGLERDIVRLGWEERRWTRGRMRTAAGREIALALPTGTILAPGAILIVERGWYLAVEGLREPLIAIRPATRAAAIRIAFEIGNRHFPLAIDGDAILAPDDPAIKQLAVRLGEPWERIEAVFMPLAGGGSPHHHEH